MTATWMVRYREVALLGLSAVLVAGNWLVQPARAVSWMMAATLIATMAVALVVARRGDRQPPWRETTDALRSGVAFAGLMLAIVLSAKLARSMGVLEDADGGRRLTMAVLGGFFIVTGNAMPKRLTPLSALSCNPAVVQAFQRFTGWTWVLTGAGFSLAWLTLPLLYAEPASLLVLTGGMLAVVSRIAILLLRKPRPA